MKILQTNFFGDHNLGLYARASDKFCLLGKFLSEKIIDKIENILKVKIVSVGAAKTDFAGIFYGINSNGIVAPKIVSDIEIEKLMELKREFSLNLLILKSRFTAIGNLILCNDRGAAVSKFFTKMDNKQIGDCLGVEIKSSRIGNMDVVGSSAAATNKGCVVHRDSTEEEVKDIEDILKVKVDIGTANFGSPFLGSCLFANSNGLVVGESTTGPEITRIMETLDLI